MKLIASAANINVTVLNDADETLFGLAYENYQIEVDVSKIINEAGVIAAAVAAVKEKIAELDLASDLASSARVAKRMAASKSLED